MTSEQLTVLKDVSIVVAGAAALIGLLASASEYLLRGRVERAKQFVELRRRFLEDPSFRDILELLDSDSPLLAEVPLQSRRNFIGFLEELGLMVNSRLVKVKVAHYMFGHYIGLAAKSRHLWAGLDPESRYWTMFWHTAKKNSAMEADSFIADQVKL